MHNHYTNDLIEIKDEGTILYDSFTENGEKHIYIEQKKREHTCPRCGETTSRVHDYRVRKIKHQYNLGNKTYLHYRRRRYVCIHCGKRFAENNSFVEKHHKISIHTKKVIFQEYPYKQSTKDIADRLNISSHTVMRHVKKHISIKRAALPEVLSIDEFKNLSEGDGKYAFLMVDPIHKKVIDVFPNRRKHNLIRYFSKIPMEERKQVKYVISDLWDPYRKLVKKVFPNALLVADKYHFIRQLYWGLQDIRIRVMKKQAKHSIEYYVLKKYWSFFLKYTHNLSLKHFKSHRLGYHITPNEIVDMAKAIDPDLKLAIELKDEFYELLHSTDFDQAQEAFDQFNFKLKQSKLPEYQIVYKTFKNWRQEILHSFISYTNQETGELCSLTNGFIEGLNNKVKALKKIAFGYPNFNNFKLKIYACTNANITFTFTQQKNRQYTG